MPPDTSQEQQRRACMTPSQLASIAMLMSLPVRHVWPTWRSRARAERASIGVACERRST